MVFNLVPALAKFLLRFNPFNCFIIVCRGYNEDLENFTELVWEDDCDLDFYDEGSYPQF